MVARLSAKFGHQGAQKHHLVCLGFLDERHSFEMVLRLHSDIKSCPTPSTSVQAAGSLDHGKTLLHTMHVFTISLVVSLLLPMKSFTCPSIQVDASIPLCGAPVPMF